LAPPLAQASLELGYLGTVSGDKILDLKNNVLIYHRTWKVKVPGTGACSLNAATNVQGQINSVAAGRVCHKAAMNYTGKFIHNEQDPGLRTVSDWIPAVERARRA